LENRVSTFAGSSNTDGVGSDASFNRPAGITTDGVNIYVADTGNNIIRKVDIATHAVTTLVGDSEGIGTAYSRGIAMADSDIYLADAARNIIRKVAIDTGAVSDFAGAAPGENAIGKAATFGEPNAVTTDGIWLFVTDIGNNTIRTIVIATGEVTTVTGGSSGNVDGISTAAKLKQPNGITTDGYSLFVTDSGNNTIRKID
jgi:hypothetical protein